MLTYAIECHQDFGMHDTNEERIRIWEAFIRAERVYEIKEMEADTGIPRQSLTLFKKEKQLGKPRLRLLAEWLEGKGYLIKDTASLVIYSSTKDAMLEFKKDRATLDAIIDSELVDDSVKIQKILEFCLGYGLQAQAMLQRVAQADDAPQ